MNRMICILVLMTTLVSSAYAKNHCARVKLDEKSIITVEHDGSKPVTLNTTALDGYTYGKFSAETAYLTGTLTAMRTLLSPKPHKEYDTIGLVSAEYEGICYLAFGGEYNDELFVSYNYGLKKITPEGAIFHARDDGGFYDATKKLIIK